MKVIKIVFGIVSALWALAYVPKLLDGTSQYGDLAFSHMMGAVVGILIASSISIALFRSASRS